MLGTGDAGDIGEEHRRPAQEDRRTNYLSGGEERGSAAVEQRTPWRGRMSVHEHSVTLPPTSPVAGVLDPILKPRTIAVLGASRTPNTIGHQIVANLVDRGFTGAVYPVNPKAGAVHALPAWASISAIPAAIDVAIVAVPKEHVLDVAEECGAKGVKGLVVISAGFREVGGAGVERERRLLEVVRRHGMRMVGPNCMGMINTDPAYSMNATFVRPMPPFGPAAFVSQSGAIGANVLDYASEYGVGIAQFVSMGNKPDVSGNDLLLQWEQDPQIGVILMYVENFGNPRHFLEIAARVTRTKPIIVVKAGRSAVGARAASSHTGALAASDSAVEALMQQAGVIRAGSIEVLFDMAMAFSVLRPPRGRRTAVVTNSGGPGVLAADALEEHGLELVEFLPETVARIAPLFPAEASIRNPLDMIVSANAAGYRIALEAILADASVDAAVAIFTPPLGVRTADVSEAIGTVALAHPDKPVLAVLMGREGLPQGKRELQQAGVPAYIFPESAALALGALVRHAERVARPERSVPDGATLRVDASTVRAILDNAVARGERKLSELDALAVIEAYGIPTVGARVARTAEEAAAYADAFGGGPVVLKIASLQVIHKTDVGGVRLGLTGPDAVCRAFTEIVDRVRRAVPEAVIDGVLVQRQLRAEREFIAGISRQPEFGALVMVGLGGVLVEVLRDVSFRVAPIDAQEAEDMLLSLRGSGLLGALRGMPAVNRAQVADVLVRVARLGADFPQIEELDINPLLLSADGGVAVDARVLLAESPTL